MEYLLIYPNNKPFISVYYDYENHYVDGMLVFNLTNRTYSSDGINLKEIEADHL